MRATEEADQTRVIFKAQNVCQMALRTFSNTCPISIKKSYNKEISIIIYGAS